MINPVSFRSTTGNFSQLVHKPQTYTTKEQPAAAATIKGEKKKGSLAKKLLVLVGTAAAVATGLAVGYKKGLFNKVTPETNKYIKTGMEYLDKAGKFVYDTAAKTTVVSKSQELLNKTKEQGATEEVAETLTETVEEAVTEVIENL